MMVARAKISRTHTIKGQVSSSLSKIKAPGPGYGTSQAPGPGTGRARRGRVPGRTAQSKGRPAIETAPKTKWQGLGPAQSKGQTYGDQGPSAKRPVTKTAPGPVTGRASAAEAAPGPCRTGRAKAVDAATGQQGRD